MIPAPIGHRPAAGSDEELASLRLDEEVWQMRRDGHTFAAIGVVLKMTRQSVTERYNRVLNRFEADHSRWLLAVQMKEYEDLTTLKRAIWPKLVSDTDPTFTPRAEDVNAYLGVSKAIRSLAGVDGLQVEAPEPEPESDAGSDIADNLDRTAELLRKLGVNMNPDLDEDDADDAVLVTIEGLPDCSQGLPWEEVGQLDEGDSDETCEEDEEEAPESLGRWVDGKWVPSDD
jgi:hypothetical protein